MGQTGLVAVDLVACTCQEVVGAKKKYLQSLTIDIVFELIYYTNGHPRA